MLLCLAMTLALGATTPTTLPYATSSAGVTPSVAPSCALQGSDSAPLAAGRRALEAGALDEARAHFRVALDSGTQTVEAFDGLMAVAVAQKDDDALLAYAHDRALAAAAANGAVPDAPRGLAPTGPAARWPAELAKLRAAAAAELVGEASKRTRGAAREPEALLVAAWLRRLALELVQPMPNVLAALQDGLDPTVHAVDGGHVAVLKALERVMTSASSNGRNGEAVRAARILHGLGAQADFAHLEGPRPGGMARWRAAGAEMLARARERLDAEHPDPWTVDELEWLSSEEGEAFTRAHASFALPGVAVSPRGWYRIESDCGYETLLGVASTVEDHHRRLVAHFGSDPFIADAGTERERVLRQGLVRIVPGADGLEAEGAPYFWVGGFQAGDVTVLRFAVGNIEGLGHGLTHELTHRFDGALNPGIPAWLAEGKAVWTGAAYAHSSERSFVSNHASFGTLSRVRNDGYGGVGKLRALVGGEPEDYRENYSAGYALYVYLSTWPLHGERPLFRARLAAFEQAGGAKVGDGLRAKFVAHFCDGKEGRPATLEAFAEGFGAFLAGFYWKEPAEWRGRYTEDLPKAPASSWVYDDPTWVWSWQRAEPSFGQDQARLAGELLLDVGRREDAAAALVWARSQDGFVPRTHGLLSRALEGGKRGADALWVLGAELAFPNARAKDAAPMSSGLRATRALLDGYAAAIAATEGPRARTLLVCEHDRLARWLGMPELGPAGSGAAAAAPLPAPDGTSPASAQAPASAAAPVPVDERAPQRLAAWEDARLTGYDQGRPKRAFAPLGDDLLLGRTSDRSGTGRIDRSGGQMAFALAEPWLLPGAYRVRTRVRFTTGYNELEVVLGYTRRDRNVRFRVTAGDYQYAIGEEDAEPEFEEVSFGFTGLRERDAGLQGAATRGVHQMGRSKTVVEVELLVDGASVTAYLDGEEVASYHTIDGGPIEGRIGFAIRHGAVRLERPTVQRLDRGDLAQRPLRSPRALDLATGIGPRFDGLVNLPVRGLAPSTTGRIVMWYPGDEDLARPEQLGDKVARAATRLSERARAGGIVQPLTIAAPRGIGPERLGALRLHAASLDPPVEVVTHDLGAAAVGEALDQAKRWLFFVDASNVVRVTLPWVDGAALREQSLVHWLTVFRDNGAPPRDLPPVERRGGDEE
ncbi:MAG: hypothetical protein R3F49_01495 [Planctomycetota bacterium]